jgi:uncharacterized membrane protein YgcG
MHAYPCIEKSRLTLELPGLLKAIGITESQVVLLFFRQESPSERQPESKEPATMGWIVIAAVLLVAVYFTARELQKKSPSELDLESVREAMVEKHHWDFDRAMAAEREYSRFLTLLQLRPGFMLVPWLDSEGRDDLDQFWHQHILDTAKYAADCKALFGRMIHHNPHLVRGSDAESDSIDKTRRLYARTFQSGPFGSPANDADFSSCSACAALMTDPGHHASGSSHGHGDSSGHDGGHSGGGHSCGGHGCGHGCGGGGH